MVNIPPHWARWIRPRAGLAPQVPTRPLAQTHAKVAPQERFRSLQVRQNVTIVPWGPFQMSARLLAQLAHRESTNQPQVSPLAPAAPKAHRRRRGSSLVRSVQLGSINQTRGRRAASVVRRARRAWPLALCHLPPASPVPSPRTRRRAQAYAPHVPPGRTSPAPAVPDAQHARREATRVREPTNVPVVLRVCTKQLPRVRAVLDAHRVIIQTRGRAPV